MNLRFLLTSRHLFWILIAPPLMAFAGCDETSYSYLLNEYCLQQFQLEMEGLGVRLWCDWKATEEIYTDVTNCTRLLANHQNCYWPNHIVDHFFTNIHRNYFKNCALTGRLPADPPFPVLCSFIFIPILITVLMTALVVWRSKRSEGIV
ncbi:PREDICTED: receptor activity-modifying protein 1 [Nanorana parkeri]|uniref:receptor activity-modifying protein 1 n=1 Tax=Nanorana parkeri TaxID=125878 RepID=UPI00085498EE|nr:PREDICTED: receptor activity-modifying protein 1 [Nanorana parkeri]